MVELLCPPDTAEPCVCIGDDANIGVEVDEASGAAPAGLATGVGVDIKVGVGVKAGVGVPAGVAVNIGVGAAVNIGAVVDDVGVGAPILDEAGAFQA